ncbi:BA75_04109T0 [Komagataella pastoris]|uniref:BA75_04109T0 n=1 Tax=Komagataella pastoris TaxID=4922 RepID=A0A1B2JER1_PICPA|nr:BA75_04109T0 [Komagataella pastoris]
MKFIRLALVATVATVAHSLLIPSLDETNIQLPFSLPDHTESPSLKLQGHNPFDASLMRPDPIQIYSTGDNAIANRYIITVDNSITDSELQQLHEYIKDGYSFLLYNKDPFFENAGTLTRAKYPVAEPFNIGDSMKGFVGFFPPRMIERLASMDLPIVAIETDSVVHSTKEYATDEHATWGLARISQRETLDTDRDYIYHVDGGKNVTAYVIDTGIFVEHEQFEKRARWGATIPYGDIEKDFNGHGTHVAGTIGSAKYGVAKQTSLVAVKVLRSDGSGTLSDVIKGIEFVVKDHNSSKGKSKGSVANMSLGGGLSVALSYAVNAAVDNGIHFAVAAGNDNANACSYSPANAAKAITAGASTVEDERAFFSNWGTCVDVFAPGYLIESTYVGLPTSTRVLSGTSMASPHVAGLLSYYLSLQPGHESQFHSGDSLTPAQLKARILSFSTKDVLDDSDLNYGTPNLLIYNSRDNITEFWGY